jgi:hypothetical protein
MQAAARIKNSSSLPSVQNQGRRAVDSTIARRSCSWIKSGVGGRDTGREILEEISVVVAASL